MSSSYPPVPSIAVRVPVRRPGTVQRPSLRESAWDRESTITSRRHVVGSTRRRDGARLTPRRAAKAHPDPAKPGHRARAARLPTPLSTMYLYPTDGTVHRVPSDATAFSYRDVTWSMAIAGIDADPASAERLRT